MRAGFLALLLFMLQGGLAASEPAAPAQAGPHPQLLGTIILMSCTKAAVIEWLIRDGDEYRLAIMVPTDENLALWVAALENAVKRRGLGESVTVLPISQNCTKI